MTEVAKVDLREVMKPYWAPPTGAFSVIEVPETKYICIDGEGDPNTSIAYQQALNWLYAISYSIKFASKKAGKDYTVAPLEGLWWSDDMDDFSAGRRDSWKWTAMIMQPDWIDDADYLDALTSVRAKLGDMPHSLRFETLAEGLSAQTLYVGPYDEEGPTISRLHNVFLKERGLVANGLHHEIYLSDPRRTQPSKLRTVIRQPVRQVGSEVDKAPAAA